MAEIPKMANNYTTARIPNISKEDFLAFRKIREDKNFNYGQAFSYLLSLVSQVEEMDATISELAKTLRFFLDYLLRKTTVNENWEEITKAQTLLSEAEGLKGVLTCR